MCPRSAASRALLMCWLLLSASERAAAEHQLSAEYESLIRRYAGGEHETAVVELLGWPKSRVLAEATALDQLARLGQACHSCPAAVSWQRIPVRAALMLHTDALQRAWNEGRTAGGHDSAAAAIARMMQDDKVHAPAAAFLRSWFEAVASMAQAETRWDDALAWCERGLREFPDSTRLLLVAGSVQEMQASPRLREVGPGVGASEFRAAKESLSRQRSSRTRLDKARAALRSALALDPTLTPVLVRLGRIAWLLDRKDEARSLLERALSSRPAPETAFLAHLFLARLDEDAGRLEEARGSYEAALELDPTAQSARLGLSSVRLGLGDHAAARAQVETALEHAGRRARPDAFWLYPWSESADAGAQLHALRRQVRP